MPPADATLEQIFEALIQTLALTLRPGTVAIYRWTARRFLSDLRTAFPQIRTLSELRRDPHMLAWFRRLCEQQPPLCNQTRTGYFVSLRRLLNDLADSGHSIQPGLILPEDLPPQSHYFPKPRSLPDDQLLQQELRRTDDLLSNALLLTRLTGIRIGECIDLALHCLRQIGPDAWGLHVPLGKLHTERLVPVDDDIRQTVARIQQLRTLDPAKSANSEGFLLPRCSGPDALYQALHSTLAEAAKRAGCSGNVTPHQLRTNFASEMIRLSVSLPALMQLLGHKDIRMTLRYVQVTQPDLQREFHATRQKVTLSHRPPVLSIPHCAPNADPPGIRQAIAASRHLLEMYRRGISNEKTRRQLQRLDRRLLDVAKQLDPLVKAEQ